MELNKCNLVYIILVLIFALGVVLFRSVLHKQDMSITPEDAVQRLREYLRIDTSRKENLKLAVEFWRKQAAEVGLGFSALTPSNTDAPVVIMTLQGTAPELQAIMLNSHMDVVAAEEKYWTYPPFTAHMDDQGNIFGRGAQDTKDVSIQYIEAIRRIISDNVTLARTVHITLMPDEETGGINGMHAFIKTEEFRKLNMGFALDEGLTSTTDTLYATYQDKRPWQIEFIIEGDGGHGFSTRSGLAMEKAIHLMNIIMDYRNSQMQLMKTRDNFDFGSYTTVNINEINAGVAPNILPNKVVLVVDIRLSVKADVSEMDSLIHSWVNKTGNNVTMKYIRRENVSIATAVDKTNPFWVAMQDAAKGLDIKIKAVVCPATSDMLAARASGVPGLGFAPRTRTAPRLHGPDEYTNVATFIQGIRVYKTIIEKLANVR